VKILVINCGSSSIKAEILESQDGARIRRLRIERIGTEDCALQIENEEPSALGGQNHEQALQHVFTSLMDGQHEIDAIGHRVVHGGEEFSQSVLITSEVEAAIERLIPLAPLHNPANLTAIRTSLARYPDLPQIAVFDTAFHATLPRRARAYALPRELTEKYGLKRYGFHGPSHSWVARQASAWLGEDTRDLRLITCHLGNGCSVAAIENGRSVETSMGMTPLEGLVMGTRSGDLDPGILIDLLRKEDMSVEALDKLLNKDSGLKGLSGLSHDLRDIEAQAAEGNDACRLAIQVFSHRLRKYIGAYAAVMGGADAIVFTGGIGENSALIRHRVAQRLAFLGARIDEDRNRDAKVSVASPVCEISESNSRTRLLVIATDESRAIAEESAKLVMGQNKVSEDLKIPIAISARHIHLTQDTVEALFGKGHTLTPYKPLSQPGQFASEEKLTIVGPKRSLEDVRVLGPTRSKCQVEVSRTDEFWLGIDAPVRNSGDVKNSPGVTLVGPAGTVTLPEGLICARRHIHMTPDDAMKLGVKDRDIVEVAIDSDGRDLIFGDVLIRVKASYALEMHIDTDEANAAEIKSGQIGSLAITGRTGRLRQRNTEFDTQG
jgi:acetate kinase